MTKDLLSAIEAEIALLRRARAILDAGSKGTWNKAAEIPKPKRTMSAATRKRMAAAQRKSGLR
jgi:hypothetical protein